MFAESSLSIIHLPKSFFQVPSTPSSSRGGDEEGKSDGQLDGSYSTRRRRKGKKASISSASSSSSLEPKTTTTTTEKALRDAAGILLWVPRGSSRKREDLFSSARESPEEEEERTRTKTTARKSKEQRSQSLVDSERERCELEFRKDTLARRSRQQSGGKNSSSNNGRYVKNYPVNRLLYASTTSLRTLLRRRGVMMMRHHEYEECTNKAGNSFDHSDSNEEDEGDLKSYLHSLRQGQRRATDFSQVGRRRSPSDKQKCETNRNEVSKIGKFRLMLLSEKQHLSVKLLYSPKVGKLIKF